MSEGKTIRVAVNITAGFPPHNPRYKFEEEFVAPDDDVTRADLERGYLRVVPPAKEEARESANSEPKPAIKPQDGPAKVAEKAKTL